MGSRGGHRRIPPRKLTTRQALFVAAYLKTFEASKAALEAGYSAHTVDKEASNLLRYPEVAAAVQKAIEDRNARVLITADRVVREIARVALADPRAFFDAAGNLKAPDQLTADEAAAIASIEVVEKSDGSISRKVKLHSKVHALELLAKHVGVVNDAPAQSNVSVAIQVVSGVPRVPTDDA